MRQCSERQTSAEFKLHLGWDTSGYFPLDNNISDFNLFPLTSSVYFVACEKLP
jgi:hypothetical protein